MNKDNSVSNTYTSITRLSKKSKIVKTIINAVEDKKGDEIALLDLRKIEEAVADFFLICSVDSHVQARAVIEEIEKQVKENCNEKPMSKDGESKQGWVVIDYFDITVHVFTPEMREKYQLEELWADAE